MKTTIGDSAIYLMWAWQGVIMDDVNIDFEIPAMVIHLSVPNRSDLRDKDGHEMSGNYLMEKVTNIAKSLSYSFKARQDIDIVFKPELRDEWWHKEYAKDSIREVLTRMENEDPFQLI